MRRSLRILVLLLVPAALLPATSASAAVSSEVSGGTLTITGTSGRDTVLVDCSGGAVKVGGADPGSGPALCEDITAIEVRVEDDGDIVVLTDVTAEEFTSLTSVLVDGGGGNDVLVGSPGDDDLRGGAGLDAITPGGGRDVVDGGPDTDRLDVSGTAGLTLRRAKLDDGGDVTTFTSIEEARITTTVRGVVIDATRFRGSMYVQTGDGRDRLLLGRGIDFANGGGGRDRILGGAGGDYLVGGSGRDLLKGQGGPDALIGGPGRDRCYGGSDNDRFATCEIAVE